MAVAKKTYIDVELKWAEVQLKSWKQYVDANPLHTIELNGKKPKQEGLCP